MLFRIGVALLSVPFPVSFQTRSSPSSNILFVFVSNSTYLTNTMPVSLNIPSVIIETLSLKCHIDQSFYILSYCIFVEEFNFNFLIDLHEDKNGNKII